MIALWILGIISGLLAAIFFFKATDNYMSAQAHRIEGKDKDPIGAFDSMRFTFDPGNYTERGKAHRNEYYRCGGYATISLFALIFIIFIGILI